MIRRLCSAALLACGTVALLAACEQSATSPGTGQPAQVATVQETFKDFGDYVVHFNAFTTDQLTPENAQAYGVTRAHNRAMLNVTILRKSGVGVGSPVGAKVEVTTSNLTGQLKNLSLREIVEGDGKAIYYIGDVPVGDDETLVFDLRITPESETSPLAVKFQRRFHF